MIKAIETQYKGYRFRSRLEARWAVFFDALGIEWEYEPQGFNMDGVYYLPDFYLVNLNLWIETKGVVPSEKEMYRMRKFSEAQDKYDDFVCLVGYPSISETGIADYSVMGFDGKYLKKEPNRIWLECYACSGLDLEKWYPREWETQGKHSCKFCEHVGCEVKPCKELHGYLHNPNGQWNQTNFWWITNNPFSPATTPKLMNAYRAAKSARFEHGESPR